MSYWLQIVGIFIAMFVTDVCWTLYFIKLEARRGIAAGLYAGIIYLLGAITVKNYVEDFTLIMPAIAGSFLGTWLTIEWKKRKESGSPRG